MVDRATHTHTQQGESQSDEQRAAQTDSLTDHIDAPSVDGAVLPLDGRGSTPSHVEAACSVIGGSLEEAGRSGDSRPIREQQDGVS